MNNQTMQCFADRTGKSVAFVKEALEDARRGHGYERLKELGIRVRMHHQDAGVFAVSHAGCCFLAKQKNVLRIVCLLMDLATFNPVNHCRLPSPEEYEQIMGNTLAGAFDNLHESTRLALRVAAAHGALSAMIEFMVLMLQLFNRKAQ